MGLRLTAALAAILLLPCAAHAGVAEELTAAIKQCAAITEDATRHACYDRLPTLLKAPGPDVAAPATDVQSWADNEKRAIANGFNVLGGEPVPPDHIAATVESFTYDYGVFVVTLDNGQVWRQVSPDKSLVHLSKDKKDQVMIWRSSFGYDVMKIRGFHVTYHVRRIK